MEHTGNSRSWSHTGLYLLAVSFLVGGLAFVNRYPLVYFDTHAYIKGMFDLTPLWDRPMGYPFMMRAVTWLSTLWTVVIFQGFLIAWLLLEWLRRFLPSGVVVWKVHLALLVILLLLTSMPWYAAQIMPDVFAPITALALGLLLFAPELERWKRALLWPMLFYFLDQVNRIVHLALLLSVVVIAWHWRTTPSPIRDLAMLLLAWVFLNALVTASLANVYDRLQSRVAWLVVLVACLMLMRTAWGERMIARVARADA